MARSPVRRLTLKLSLPPFSPVHIARKFSAWRGDSCAYSTNSSRPCALPLISTSRKTRGLPGRSRRVRSASVMRASSAFIAAASVADIASPLVQSQPGPLPRTWGSGIDAFFSQHSPFFCVAQPPSLPQKTHTEQPRSPRSSARLRWLWHDSQHAAASFWMLLVPHRTTSPSYSRFCLNSPHWPLPSGEAAGGDGGGGGGGGGGDSEGDTAGDCAIRFSYCALAAACATCCCSFSVRRTAARAQRSTTAQPAAHAFLLSRKRVPVPIYYYYM